MYGPLRAEPFRTAQHSSAVKGRAEQLCGGPHGGTAEDGITLHFKTFFIFKK